MFMQKVKVTEVKINFSPILALLDCNSSLSSQIYGYEIMHKDEVAQKRGATVYSRYISRLCISRNWIYRGRMLDPFFCAQERDIFREIAVTPWTQFAGDNFSRILFTAIAFVPGSQETIFRKINSSLPVNAGWNTCCAMVSHSRRSIDTSIVSYSRAQLIHFQSKSRLHIANLGINNAF